MQKDKVLITGGSGFIGSNLIANLLIYNKHQILNIDIKRPINKNQESLWTKIDIRNEVAVKKIVKEFNPNIVIHLAARTDLGGHTLDEYDTNTKGTRILINCLKELSEIKRVIFASSMYVCRPGYQPKSSVDYDPHTIYGLSKVEMEKIILNETMNYEWVIVRPTSIWGPGFGEPYNRFFQIVMSKKYFHFGKRACNKTYGYIENTIYQIKSIIDASSEIVNKRVFYLGDYIPYNISEWANEIAECLQIHIPYLPYQILKIGGWCGDIMKIIGIKFPLTSFRVSNMTTDNVIELSAIYDLAPNLPVSRKEGIRKTIDWMQYQ